MRAGRWIALRNVTDDLMGREPYDFITIVFGFLDCDTNDINPFAATLTQFHGPSALQPSYLEPESRYGCQGEHSHEQPCYL